MKRGVLIIVVLLLLFPFNVFATSGCCSHHGGVDCSRIRNDGGVICNDGYMGSSCSYASMKKCGGVSIEFTDGTDEEIEIEDEVIEEETNNTSEEDITSTTSSKKESNGSLLPIYGIGSFVLYLIFKSN